MITADDLGKLRHALGVANHRKPSQWGLRNYYATYADDEAMARLVQAGFMHVGGSHGEGQLTYFHATLDGCKAVGLNARQIKRAMEPS